MSVSILLNCILRFYLYQFLDPRWDAPSRFQLRVMITDLHHQMCMTIKKQLAEATALNIVIDAWTQRGNTQGYLEMIVQFCDTTDNKVSIFCVFLY